MGIDRLSGQIKARANCRCRHCSLGLQEYVVWYVARSDPQVHPDLWPLPSMSTLPPSPWRITECEDVVGGG